MTQRRENMQRLQIGGLGLFAVVLLVGLASVANNRASNEVPVTEEIADTGLPGGAETDKAETPKEPLAELGAVPAPEETPAPKAQ
ncbi:hypothetical protein [Novosphingopyxis sp.]|uniref:hypothetical protein n=1 Tax=Novosphingopyxis sp. TaxID=2709690 RepID=UPI003B58EA76